MTDKFVQQGDVITITAATGGVTQGAIYRGDESAGVYVESATGGDLVGVALEGVFTLTKAAGGGLNLAIGEKAYATTGLAVTPATGANNLPIGIAVAAAATGDTTAAIKLDRF
jgi:predicted RecA/RadA family phage recombinase